MAGGPHSPSCPEKVVDAAISILQVMEQARKMSKRQKKRFLQLQERWVVGN